MKNKVNNLAFEVLKHKLIISAKTKSFYKESVYNNLESKLRNIKI